MRLTRSELERYTNDLRSRFGSIEAETEGGALILVPPGSSAPTAPDRIPTRPVPRSRDRGGLVETAVDIACSLYNPSPGGFIDRYLDFSEYTNSVSVADSVMRGICGAPAGSPEPAGAPVGPPLPPARPFTGGQCPGEFYGVDMVITVEERENDFKTINFTAYNASLPAVGPVQLVEEFFVPPGGGLRTEYRVLEANGGESNVFAFSFIGAVPTYTMNVYRIDGQPDDCGDPPETPAIPPGPLPPPQLPPWNYDPEDFGSPVSLEPEFGISIGPNGPSLRIDLDADFRINVDVGGVDINFPRVPGGTGPCEEGPPPPDSQQPSPEEPPPPPRPPEVPPDDPATEESETAMVAVVVTATSIDTHATNLKPTGGAPDVFAPRLGSLQFKIGAGSGVSGWTSDIDIKNAQQYIAVPAEQGAVDVRVFPYGSTTFRVTRLYAEVDANLGVPSP